MRRSFWSPTVFCLFSTFAQAESHCQEWFDKGSKPNIVISCELRDIDYQSSCTEDGIFIVKTLSSFEGFRVSQVSMDYSSQLKTDQVFTQLSVPIAFDVANGEVYIPFRLDNHPENTHISLTFSYIDESLSCPHKIRVADVFFENGVWSVD